MSGKLKSPPRTTCLPSSPLHISSPLHSTPKRTNKRDQRSDATSAVQYSPIDGAQPKTSDQINTSHGFSCTVSHTTHTSMSSSHHSSSDADFEHSTNFPFAKKHEQIRVCTFREKVNSEFSDNEDCCMSCVKGTKCYCITCDQPICNWCSKFEGNEETSSWQAGERVVVWKPLTEITAFTTFWSRHFQIGYSRT